MTVSSPYILFSGCKIKRTSETILKGECALKTIGYCRISTPTQSIDRQERNILAAYPEALIVKETYSGMRADRPKWNRILNEIRGGNAKQYRLVFDSVSRMSRDAESGFKAYEELFNAGAELVFLKEPSINTAVYRKALESGDIPMTGGNVDLILQGVNAYLKALRREQIRIAFEQSEKEVLDLRRRTSEGMLTAKLNGKQIGHPKGTTYETKKAKKAKEFIRKHNKTFGGQLTNEATWKAIGISRTTFYKYKNEMLNKDDFPVEA